MSQTAPQYVRNAAFNWQHNSRNNHNNHNNLVPPVQQIPQGVPYQQAPMPGPAPVPPTYQPKSKMAAGLLGIFLGSLGVHNFYLGYTGKAVAQLLITLLTCGFGSVISGIWGLIEGIMILTGSIKVDGKNVPLAE